MKKALYLLHRRIAIFLAIPVLLWALSGILHPMMANWLRPEIAKTFLPPAPIARSEELLVPSQVFHNLPKLHQVKLISLNDSPVFLGITPDQNWHFYDARTGEKLTNAAERYSEQLARAYADDYSSKLVKITKVTEFSETYGTINRLLPVYRVQLDRPDGLEVVVDPRTGRLATFDTPSKRLFSRLFSWCHTWSFLGSPDSKFRITVIVLMSVLTLLISLSGVVSLFYIKRKKETLKSRRWHRLSGAFSAVFFFLFGLSGLAHVAAKYQYDDSTQQVSTQKIATSQLGKIPDGLVLSKLSLAVIGELSYYRIPGRQEVSYRETMRGDILQAGEDQFARQLALEFSGYSAGDIEKTEVIKKFRDDYGFIFKRLPVWRVSYKDQAIWHDTVDTEDAHLAMRTTPARLIEALSFIYLHKFHFLDFAGRNTRDVVSACAACLVSLTVIFGVLIVFAKRRHKNEACVSSTNPEGQT